MSDLNHPKPVFHKDSPPKSSIPLHSPGKSSVPPTSPITPIPVTPIPPSVIIRHDDAHSLC